MTVYKRDFRKLFSEDFLLWFMSRRSSLKDFLSNYRICSEYKVPDIYACSFSSFRIGLSLKQISSRGRLYAYSLARSEVSSQSNYFPGKCQHHNCKHFKQRLSLCTHACFGHILGEGWILCAEVGICISGESISPPAPSPSEIIDCFSAGLNQNWWVVQTEM